MNSMLLSDISLYELAIQSNQPPIVSQLNPATFKSAVSVLLDRLVETRTEAILWAKLPKGDSWQAEIDRYNTLAGVSKTIYTFKPLKEDSAEEGGMAEGITHPDMVQHPLAARHSTLSSGDSLVPIALESSGLLRREYFLIVWSAQFQGVILAHRPRSVKPDSGTDLGADESSEKKQLLTFMSFDVALVTTLLGGIETALGQTGDDTAIATRLEPVTQWQKQIADRPAPTSSMAALSGLFTQQMQKQDDLWQRYNVARKQGENTVLLERQNEELVSSVRLKDDFLSNVGQELRTPLTTIKTALTLLNSPNLKPPQRQRYMELIAKECDRQSCLITSLLDLVQLDQTAEQTAIESIKLCETVPGFVSTYQPLAEEKGIMMVYTIPEDLPAISCSKNWLRQVVINLLHNGIKFTPSGGQVWVKAKQQGEYVQLEFRDTGYGIAPHEIPKIFDRFYRVRQTAEVSSGAGLGLTIVQQLLFYCGGSISVKSRLGEGSTFNVLLPVHRADSAR